MPLLGEKDSVANPIQKYVEWKWSDTTWYFAFRDKEKKQDIRYIISDFIVVAIGYKVWWFNKQRDCGIYSNEVDNLFKDKFVVKFFDKWEEIAVGKYSEIKEKVKSAQGRLMIAITALANGELIQFTLKGEAFFQFSSLLKKMDRNRSKVKFTGKTLMKSKVWNYHLPKWEVWEDFIGTPDESIALDYAAQIKEYRSFNKARYDENIDFAEEEQDEVDKILNDDVDDDLPF